MSPDRYHTSFMKVGYHTKLGSSLLVRMLSTISQYIVHTVNSFFEEPYCYGNPIKRLADNFHCTLVQYEISLDAGYGHYFAASRSSA